MRRKVAIFLCIASSFAAYPPSVSHADTYPSRPVRIIVPAAAGGVLDVNVRRIAQKLGQSLKQPFVVENRPGATGTIGAEAAARAKADGYTIFVGSSTSLAITPSLFAKLPYHPTRDFTPITLGTRGNPVASR